MMKIQSSDIRGQCAIAISERSTVRAPVIRDQFRLGGLRSVARIFYPLLAQKSSGFARILHDFFVARIWLFTKF